MVHLVATGSAYDRFQTVVASLALAVIPVSVTIAAVRSNLFDVDVVLSRTLVYTTLTVVVGAGYLLKASDVGKSFVVLVTGSKPGYNSVTKASTVTSR